MPDEARFAGSIGHLAVRLLSAEFGLASRC